MGSAAWDRAVGDDKFRGTLRRHAAGVVVVTAEAEGSRAGITVTSFTSASLRPPLVSFYLDRESGSAPWLGAAGHFAVNILSGDQRELADRFARKGVDRFAEPTRWHHGPFGVPVLDGVCANLVCSAHTVAAIGDHLLVVGLVVEVLLGPGRRPLLYHSGRFGGFDPQAAADARL
ncbi:flavin reductase family protein [Spongiactinospora sp. TRM90649]|uniref:flavin reductase family protein n=1 Tax=Spongiactinospora sp. TRM90649 TaxID=3031114 RepID=UPI0023F7E3FF|nr:flavin reductase family protein [Spongiactinospora sp. TRM90649]MDF5758344.1 flavin reductase family protein [Spongiactinospora sp. TRM90649]